MTSSAALFSWLMGTLLVAVRVAMLFVAVPPFASIPVPALARVVVIVALAVGLAASPGQAIAADAASLGSQILHEAVVGGSIALGLYAAFGAFQFGGRLLDFQIGFGVASLVDLATRNSAPLLGTVLSMMATMFFFAVGGHLELLRLLHLSLERIPPGGGLPSLDVGALIAQFATCFSFGFVIVAPVVFCLFLVDLGMAFMSRTMPQMNVFVMSMALKVLVGLTVLAMSIPFAGGVTHRIFDATFDGLSLVMR